LYFFQTITAHGYDPTNASLSFYPLLPLTAKILVLLGLNSFTSLLAIVSLAGLGFVIIFERLANLELTSRQANMAANMLLIFPMSMVLFIPYTEPLFLFLAALTVYCLRLKRWWLAGLTGMLATLAKQPGILLTIPMAIELWANEQGNRHWTWQTIKRWLAVGLIPLAMITWTLYRIFYIEKIIPDTSSIQSFAITTLLSSNSREMVVTRKFAWPWQVIIEAVTKAIHTPLVRLNVLFNLGGYILIALLLVMSWKYLRFSYKAFSFGIVALSLIDFSFNLCAIPIPSLFRHAYLAFPIFLGFPYLLRKKWMLLIFAVFSLILFILLVYVYGCEGWVV
jgi:Gpi18-like mannosyltransferase